MRPIGRLWSAAALAFLVTAPACDRAGTGAGASPSPTAPAAAAPTETAPDEAASAPATTPATTPAQRSVLTKAAAFLVSKQNENGSFGVIPGAQEPGEIGVTGLIVRGLAGLPGDVRTEATQAAVDRAVAYLLRYQQKDGSFSPPGTGLGTYRTALSMTALKAVDAVAHADAIQRGRRYLEGSQFSEENGLEVDGVASPYYGGWGYDKAGENPDADLSNTHFAIEALKQAGLDETSEEWKRAVVFLQRCQNRSESNDLRSKTVNPGDDGGMMYDPGLDEGKSEPVTGPDGKITIPSYASMTYAGLMSLIYANVGKDDPRVKAAWDWITKHYTLEENYGLGTRSNPRAAKQGLFYYYHVFAKALDAWGEPVITDGDGVEHRWAAELYDHLGALQAEDGSWVNDEPRWWEADPVLVTGYSLLALDIAHRWLDPK